MSNRFFNIISSIYKGTFFIKLREQYFDRKISLSEKDVFKKQEKLLKKILAHAIKNTNFYNNYFKGKSFNSLTDFPIVDKHFITKNHKDFCVRDLGKYQYGDSYTGGSTGEPFHILRSGGYEYEFGIKRWNTYGYKEGELLIALDGSKIDDELLNQGIYWKKKPGKNLPFGTFALSSLYFNDDNADIYCKYIVETKPDYIRGYPSFVYSIACHAEKNGWEVGKNVKAIELTSENVYPYQIEKIKAVFGAKVYLQYGHTEACVCANTYDETYKYRVEPLYGYVEILNEEGQHVNVGEVGEVVVTTLHNYAMPLIRYRTGDFAEYGGKDDRYIYLNRVLGRTQDYIIDKNGNKVLLTALIFAQHCKALGHIAKWQLEQNIKGEVIAHIVKGAEFTDKDEKEVYNLFKNSGNVNTTFNYVKDIPLTPRGKSKMLKQNIVLD